MDYLKLVKSDIHSIADTVYQEEGNCVFVFDGDLDAFGIKYIFLRNLLQLCGEEYVIVSEDEYWDDKNQVSIYLFTNLPWDVYMNATKANDEDYE